MGAHWALADEVERTFWGEIAKGLLPEEAAHAVVVADLKRLGQLLGEQLAIW